MSVQKKSIKKIDFITLSRSDYAGICPLVKCALQEPDIESSIIAGGSHLLARFGRTIESIQEEFQVDEVVDFLLEEDTSIAKSYSQAVFAFTEVLQRRQPDLIFILGDRWELLAVASAASMLRIPIAHHSGGDITQGSMDNQIRYALSALAHIHFVALDEHAKRLTLIGEEDWRVVVSGEPALSHLADFVPDDSIYSFLGLQRGEPYVLATFHPTSFDDVSYLEQIELYKNVLDALDLAVIITAPNPDSGNQIYFQRLKEFSEESSKIRFIVNLGEDRYYQAMRHAEFMLGNSSSGIWEAPSFALPVINIGRRQEDRYRCGNVIDVGFNVNDILNAVKMVQGDKFKNELNTKNPYVNNNTNQIIIHGVKNAPGRDALLNKKCCLTKLNFDN